MSNLPTPDDILTYWIGDTRDDADAIATQNKLWFGKSAETDEYIRTNFFALFEDMSNLPFAEDWAARGPRERLAAIIVLDQFSRNMFRDSPEAFAHDNLARLLCKDGLALGCDEHLSETERVFFCLPLEHSESLEHQDRAVAEMQKIADEARPDFREWTANTLQYAKDHRKVIADFGRFPHRNKALGRESTPEEKEWLAEGGGF